MLRPLTRLSGTLGVLGTWLVGVPASDVPTGFPKNGLINNDIGGSDPAGTLYRVEILEADRPASGTLTINENGSLSLTGAADGHYTGVVTNYKNDVGTIGSYDITVGATSGATVSGVSVSPGSGSMAGGGSRQFTATVSGTGSPSQSVTWQTSAGTISSGGLLTAPAATGSAQTVTVTATSTLDGSKSGTATVTIAANVQATVSSVSVSPATPTVLGLATRQFTATVAGTNSPPQAVTWAASGGTISSNGLFTAPAATDTAQIINITATSTADGSKIGTATLTVAIAADPDAPTVPASRMLIIGPESVAGDTAEQNSTSAYVLRGRQFSIAKDPQARLAYGIDLAPWLAELGTSLLTATCSVSGVEVDGGPYVVGTTLVAWVKGGEINLLIDRLVENCVTFHFVCADSSEDDRTVFFNIQDH